MICDELPQAQKLQVSAWLNFIAGYHSEAVRLLYQDKSTLQVMRFAQKTSQRHGERQVLRFQEPWEVNSVFGHGLNLALSTVRLTQWNEKDETAWWIWGARGQEARKRNLISIEKYMAPTMQKNMVGEESKRVLRPCALCTRHLHIYYMRMHAQELMAGILGMVPFTSFPT